MKSEEEIDRLVMEAGRTINFKEFDRIIKRLAEIGKSALADTERIDALERDARVFSPPGSDNELNGVVVSWYPSKGQTLRQAIDERRKA